ncbi:DUF397 domain-containing protein [Streptomyces sp. NPDC058877]|uniref:DUF397 domain-containing protein n=1 Tax=Streptomyces sp. NPDC058877 TaxID=3346665 RepID=UPI0036C4F794
MTTPQWFKSSYSNNGGNCVEVAHNLVSTLGAVPVRDSKTPTSPTLAVSTAPYTAFIAGIKSGQLGT